MNEFEILNKRGKDMKKTKLKIMGVLTAVCLSTPVTSLAMIKNVEINADLDSVNEVDAGICFFPDYEVEDDDTVQSAYCWVLRTCLDKVKHVF